MGMFISGSSTSTGSFGRVETAGNINLKSTDNALTFTTGSKELSLSLYQALHPNGNQGTNSSALMLGGQKVFEPRMHAVVLKDLHHLQETHALIHD